MKWQRPHLLSSFLWKHLDTHLPSLCGSNAEVLSLSLLFTHWSTSTHTISAAGWQVLYCSEWSVSTGDFSSHRSMRSRTDLALWVYVCSWHLSALAAEGLLARTGTNFSLGPAQPQPLICVCAYCSGLVIITAAANSERRPQERRWRRAEREARTAENTNVQGRKKNTDPMFNQTVMRIWANRIRAAKI